MAKYKVFELLYRAGKHKKLKSQLELNSMTDSIEKIRKLETDLTYNIEETVETGIAQNGHMVKVNSKIREKMIHQKEVVENRIEFLTTEQVHLQKTVAHHDIKNKKVFLIDNLSTGHRKLINSKAKFFKIDIKNKQKIK